MTDKNKYRLLDGRLLANQNQAELFLQIQETKENPGLAVVLVGDDAPSHMYVSLKEQACDEVGISFHKYLIATDDVEGDKVLDTIKFLNLDDSIDGILIQLPLPKNLDTQKIINAIDPKKDVDGFFSTGEKDQVVPPTISAIIELLDSIGEDLSFKKTLVVAKSDIYTDKLEKYLNNYGIADVLMSNTIPDSSTDYDIIIIALGSAEALTKDMIKEGSIIIDVGINKVDGAVVGDAHQNISEKAAYVSPVPGGVGPLTVVGLLENTYELFKKNRKL
jgi:methylenetetrahydrofolate dehydrogenase (NADP+)/methenyltetrahydrofolate cyclohydrolase